MMRDEIEIDDGEPELCYCVDCVLRRMEMLDFLRAERDEIERTRMRKDANRHS